MISEVMRSEVSHTPELVAGELRPVLLRLTRELRKESEQLGVTTRTLDIACHGLLILGGLLVCLPIYFAFVVGSHTVGDVLAVLAPGASTCRPVGAFTPNSSASSVWDARLL